MKRAMITLLALAAAAAPLRAQHEHHQPPAPAGPRPAPADRPAAVGDTLAAAEHFLHVFAPERLLEHAAHLDLTIDQRDRLDGIRMATRAARDSARAAARRLGRELDDALGQYPPDAAAVEARAAALHAALGRAEQLELRAALTAMAVLDEGQRTRAAAMVEAMRRSS